MSDDVRTPKHDAEQIREWQETAKLVGLPDLIILECENDDITLLRRSCLRRPKLRWPKTYAKEIFLGVITHSIALWIGNLLH